MLVLVLAAATIIGLVVYWPEGDKIATPEGAQRPMTESAEVVGVRATACAQVAGQRDCVRVTAELKSGPDEGREITFTFVSAEGKFELGDDIRVYKNPLPPEAIGPGGQRDPYSFSAT